MDICWRIGAVKIQKHSGLRKPINNMLSVVFSMMFAVLSISTAYLSFSLCSFPMQNLRKIHENLRKVGTTASHLSKTIFHSMCSFWLSVCVCVCRLGRVTIDDDRVHFIDYATIFGDNRLHWCGLWIWNWCSRQRFVNRRAFIASIIYWFLLSYSFFYPWFRGYFIRGIPFHQCDTCARQSNHQIQIRRCRAGVFYRIRFG